MDKKQIAFEKAAPEKIFICNYDSEVSYEWHSESEFETKGHNDIEYTRTDAFIEKACKWLKNNLPNWVDSYKEDIIIEKFRRKMEE